MAQKGLLIGIIIIVIGLVIAGTALILFSEGGSATCRQDDLACVVGTDASGWEDVLKVADAAGATLEARTYASHVADTALELYAQASRNLAAGDSVHFLIDIDDKASTGYRLDRNGFDYRVIVTPADATLARFSGGKPYAVDGFQDLDVVIPSSVNGDIAIASVPITRLSGWEGYHTTRVIITDGAMVDLSEGVTGGARGSLVVYQDSLVSRNMDGVTEVLSLDLQAWEAKTGVTISSIRVALVGEIGPTSNPGPIRILDGSKVLCEASWDDIAATCTFEDPLTMPAGSSKTLIVDADFSSEPRVVNWQGWTFGLQVTDIGTAAATRIVTITEDRSAYVLAPVLIRPTIKEDRTTDDWSAFPKLNDPAGDVGNPDVDILSSAVTTDDKDGPSDALMIFVEVAGRAFRGDPYPPSGDGRSIMRFYIDNDMDLSSGFAIGDLGADVMYELWGKDGLVHPKVMYNWTNDAWVEQPDAMRGVDDRPEQPTIYDFSLVGTTYDGSTVEVIQGVEWSGITPETEFRVIIEAIDPAGNRDLSALMVYTAPPG